MTTRKVLIPIDRTDYSLRILPFVGEFISPKDTRLILLYVADPLVGLGATSSIYDADYLQLDPLPVRSVERMPHPIYAGQREDAKMLEIEACLKPLARQLEQAGYSVTSRVEFGEPAEEILRLIQDEKIDLVAMTTHAREGFKRLFFGSVAEKVLHHVHIPILLMHPSVEA